jgi:type II secretory pathway pseudopilin PulG
MAPAPKRSHRPVQRRNALSLIEILVVIGIIVLLLAMLVPSLKVARERSWRLVCTHNLRQWGHAEHYYRHDNNDYLPTEGSYLTTEDQEDKKDLFDHYTNWYIVLPPYLGLPSYLDFEGQGESIKERPELNVWICPAKNKSAAYKSHSGKNQFHYGMNQVLDGTGPAPYGGSTTPGFPDQGQTPLRAERFKNKPNTVFMFDIYPNSMAGGPKDVATTFHRDCGNILYLNGRVDHFRKKDFIKNADSLYPSIIWRHPQLYWGYTPPWQ